MAGIVKVGNLGLKAWQDRGPKRHGDVQIKGVESMQQTSSHSLLRGLLLVCVLYQGFTWIHSSWQVLDELSAALNGMNNSTPLMSSQVQSHPMSS